MLEGESGSVCPLKNEVTSVEWFGNHLQSLLVKRMKAKIRSN